MRTSPVQPVPGLFKTAAMLAVPIVLPAAFAVLLVYGWCTP